MTVFYLLCVVGGLWTIINRRNNARDHLEAQRQVWSKPNLQYDETTMKWTGVMYLIAGIVALIVGIGGLSGLVALDR